MAQQVQQHQHHHQGAIFLWRTEKNWKILQKQQQKIYKRTKTKNRTNQTTKKIRQTNKSAINKRAIESMPAAEGVTRGWFHYSFDSIECLHIYLYFIINKMTVHCLQIQDSQHILTAIQDSTHAQSIQSLSLLVRFDRLYI